MKLKRGDVSLTLVCSASFINFGDENNFPLKIYKKETPIVSNPDTVSVFFSTNFSWFGSKGIFETQDFIANLFSIILWNSLKELF